MEFDKRIMLQKEEKIREHCEPVGGFFRFLELACRAARGLGHKAVFPNAHKQLAWSWRSLRCGSWKAITFSAGISQRSGPPNVAKAGSWSLVLLTQGQGETDITLPVCLLQDKLIMLSGVQ